MCCRRLVKIPSRSGRRSLVAEKMQISNSSWCRCSTSATNLWIAYARLKSDLMRWKENLATARKNATACIDKSMQICHKLVDSITSFFCVLFLSMVAVFPRFDKHLTDPIYLGSWESSFVWLSSIFTSYLSRKARMGATSRCIYLSMR